MEGGCPDQKKERVREIKLDGGWITARVLQVSAPDFLLYFRKVGGEAEAIALLPFPGLEGRGEGETPRIG